MARFEEVYQEPDFAGVRSAERRGGFFRRYVPDFLARPLAPEPLEPQVADLLIDATREITRFGERLRHRSVGALYATLARSEGISSSWIEGLEKPAREVALAALEPDDAVAAQIHRNIQSIRAAVETLGENRPWTHADLRLVHATLAPGHHPAGGAYRSGQVFIGGSSPLTAKFVPPAAELVPAYIDDLLTYVNRSPDQPLITAALLHAQYETIHPDVDGNGRTGRALIHGVLARAGLVRDGLIPISVALRRERAHPEELGYVGALTAFRHEGGDPAVRSAARNRYLAYFLEAALGATRVASTLLSELTAVEARWAGLTAGFRGDGVIHAIVAGLPDQPVTTITHLAERHRVSFPAASNAVRQLVSLGILVPGAARRRRAEIYAANEVLDLLTLGERALASPAYDTRIAAPAGRAPKLPRTTGLEPCGRLLPRAGRACSRPAGHRGRCR